MSENWWLTMLRLLIGLGLWTTTLLLLLVATFRAYAHCKRSLRVVLITVSVSIIVNAAVGMKIAESVPVYETTIVGRNYILQMDISRVVQTVTDHWRGSYRTSVHPLQPLLVQPVTFVLQRVFYVEPFRAAQLASVLSLSLTGGLIALILYRLFSNAALALLGGCGFMSTFGFWLLSAYPESSAQASFGVVLPYAVYFLFAGRRRSLLECILFVLAGVHSIGITVTNLCHVAICMLYSYTDANNGQRRLRQAVAIVALMLFAIVLVSAIFARVMVKLYEGSAFWLNQSAFLSEMRFASVWWDGWMQLVRVLVQVLLYPLVPPTFVLSDVSMVTEAYPMTIVSAESANLSDLTLWQLIILSMLTAGWFVLIRDWLKGKIIHCSPVLLGVSAMLCLHLAYGNELLLYSGNWLGILWVCLIILIGKRRFAPGVAIAAIVILLFSSRASFRQLTAAIAQVRNLAMMQCIIGVPNQHELHRSYLGWNGRTSVGIGTDSFLISLYSENARRSSLVGMGYQLLSAPIRSISRDNYNGTVTLSSGVNRARLLQRFYPLPGGLVCQVRVTPHNGVLDNYRLYVLFEAEGPAGGRSVKTYGYDPSLRAVLANGKPRIRLSREPDHVLLGAGREALFRAALEGSIKVAPTLTELVRRRILRFGPPKSDSLLLIWNIEGSSPFELWLDCYYSPQSVDTRGNYLYQTAGLPVCIPKVPAINKPLTSWEAYNLARHAEEFWLSKRNRCIVQLPDPRWTDTFWAIMAHLATNVQEGGRMPVTPINYGVFTRDAAYMVYALLVTGQFDYARLALDYLLDHPWSGRPYPEGDTPAHILWVMHKYWCFTRDRQWLQEKLPAVRNLTDAVLALRSDGMHPVRVNVLGQVREIPPDPHTAQRYQRLASRQKPFYINYGKMDQTGLIYVNSLSLWALRGGAELLRAGGDKSNARRIDVEIDRYAKELRDLLSALKYQLDYDQRGHYVGMWPARLHEIFPAVENYYRSVAFAESEPSSQWRYFDLDLAHNMLLSGRRGAGFGVIERYLRMPLFARWKVLDEGGPSLPGYWKQLVNWTWEPTVAVPHGWALASFCLLLRDSLVFETSNRLVLLSGVPEQWFEAGQRVELKLPTEYGNVHMQLRGTQDGVELRVKAQSEPKEGIWVRLPQGFAHTEVRIPNGYTVRVRRLR